MSFLRYLFYENLFVVVALALVSLVSGILSLWFSPWGPPILCSIAAILGIAALLSYIRTRHNFRLLKQEHPALVASLDMISSLPGINKGIRVSQLVKNVLYDIDCKTSYVTYFLSGKVVSGSRDNVELIVGGGTPVTNISNINYYFSRKPLSIAACKHYHELTQEEITRLSSCRLNPTVTQEYHNALRYSLPVDVILTKGDSFYLCFSYEWKGAIITPRDSTSYLCKALFPNGIDGELATRLTFRNRPFQIRLLVVDASHKKMYVAPDNDAIRLTNADGFWDVCYTKKNPKDVIILERTIQP